MSSKPPGRLRVESDGAVRWIIFDNEPRLNAFTRDMWDALPELVMAAEQDAAVRVLVLRGAGTKAFSAGADISEFAGNRTGKDAKLYDEINHRAFMALAGCSKPTIAMVHGYCFGGGCELAICCDIRIGSTDSSYSVPAAKLSLGYNARWVRPMLGVMPAAKVKEMLFTARRYSAAEAERMGLLNSVVSTGELEEETRRMAGEISANAPLSIAAAKASVDALLLQPETADLGRLDQMVDACFSSEDYREGQRAFMEKRKPVFRGR